ncbi:MAG: hypothetical protein PWP48_2120, partial [Clostridiales bacterium]|nr:hypothetical protein [Clostridiales bacterium]
IPNTEVKPFSADGTERETAWESRPLPGLFLFFSIHMLVYCGRKCYNKSVITEIYICDARRRELF